ncbi:MAG: error-prone DNA polymerase [Acidimicrobiia bacterium]|nr:error-prone DNA polymerase [Acidimicrobiia bacterium]
MGWQNPPVPWRDVERRLSDRPGPGGGDRLGGAPRWEPQVPDAVPFGPGADGGDSPAWSRKRRPYAAPALERGPSSVPYAELHCHSSFSFLDGASHPEELAEEAARLGLEALAITDHDGFYGVVRFAEAAREVGVATVFGAELTVDKLDITPGQADPDGSHLLVLARDPRGYAALARVISEAQLAGEKGAPRFTLSDLDRWVSPAELDHWLVLTGCRKGLVPRTLEREGPAAAARALATMIDRFGGHNMAVELWDHGSPLDSARNDALVDLALRAGVEPVATNNVHYASPAHRRLASAMAAVRARRSLDEIEGWLPAMASAHLRSGDEQARRFARYPGVVERAAELGSACAFDLSLMAPDLPPFPCPERQSEMAYLRQLVEEGGTFRYGPRGSSSMPHAWDQLDAELDLIERLNFPGYFLVVWDIVDFCRKRNILCQGRGSAANSAVCYVLGITAADAVSLGLLFERFLSPERDGPPDIDLDIESDRREEAIQYVYERHGRRHAAQVANVITYRTRSAVRDAAKALGYAPGQQDAFSKSMDRWSGLGGGATGPGAGGPRTSNGGRGAYILSGDRVAGDTEELPSEVVELAREFENHPRHLGIHSGGMVMCDRPVIEVCPVEWGRMEDRTVLQWDKDDCAAAGLVKFDLLGLGMLSALRYVIDLVFEHHGVEVDIAELDQEHPVFDMLCRADSIGVFQVESRAQMATLPRLKPRNFYDLVVEVALIRPGPIQGGSVHPYIRRRNGSEEITFLHPLLKPALTKTLGIPLFQEQLMQIAIDVAGFTPGEADELRQAIGSKRSRERMERLRARFFAGMAERGIGDDTGVQIWNKLAAFANYGFPESHSISFAYLVYASSWFKLHYPAAFCAALLRAQPMGFYSPHSLIQDARRHGVPTLGPCVNTSGATAELEWVGPDGDLPPIEVVGADEIKAERYDHGWGVRLGIGSVRYIGDDLAEAIAKGRPYTSIEDVARRVAVNGQPIDTEALEALATAGAFGCFTDESSSAGARRRALWEAGAVAQGGVGKLAGIITGLQAPQLPGMSEQEEAMADLWATGVAADGHPTRFLREALTARGVVRASDLADTTHGTKVTVGGVVTHRQRPATASGTTFLGLEDETGLINVVVSVGCWSRYRQAARNAPALLVKGRVERQEAVVNIVAEKLEPLPVGTVPASRDFR